MIHLQIEKMISAVQARDISTALSIVNGDYNYTSVYSRELAENIESFENAQLNKIVTNTKEMISLSTIVSIIFLFVTILVIIFYLIYTKRGITTPRYKFQQLD